MILSFGSLVGWQTPLNQQIQWPECRPIVAPDPCRMTTACRNDNLF
jgi:hypothetical protein